jgi:RimJ/RimL family protein N-acetyltransferase
MLLRDVVEDDLDAFFEQQREPEACAMAQFPPRDREKFLLRWWSTLGDAAITKRTILDGRDVAGYVASWTETEASSDDEKIARRLVAYWLGVAFWGRGLATMALAEFVTHHETARPLHAFVATSNGASRRVLEKCGFSPALAPKKGRDGVEEILMELRRA